MRKTVVGAWALVASACSQAASSDRAGDAGQVPAEAAADQIAAADDARTEAASAPIPTDGPIAAAAATWAATKSTCGTYSYVRELMNFAGQSAVEYTGGVLTRRHFTPIFTNNGFDERGAELGTHGWGGAPKTIEELLSECATTWSPGAPGFQSNCFTPESCSFTFTANERGVPLQCFPRPMAVVEGVLGIVVRGFACAPLNDDGSVPVN